MPIVMSKDEWTRIAKWTNENKEDPETARRREYVKLLDEKSREMTKSWPNSLENVNKRNEEARRARIEVAEQANSKFYKRYVRRQREQQERLMHSARDMVFKSKDAPKLLLSAVIETVIQKERDEQVKFNKELQQCKLEEKRKSDDEIIRKAKEWHELMETRKKRRFEVNKVHQKEILEQAKEIEDRKQKEYEDELNMQKIDNVKANEEMAAIKKFEEEFKAAEKARIWADMNQARKDWDERRLERAARDELDDRLIHLLIKSRDRVENMRKNTEKELRAEKLRVLEKISQKLQTEMETIQRKSIKRWTKYTEMEQASLDKAISEKDAVDENRRQAQLRKLAQFKQDKIDSRNKFLRDEAQRLHEQRTMQQWECMNRFKNIELYEEFQEKLRKEKQRKIKEYREDILKLWKEREEREAREREETRYFYGELALKKMRDADNKVLTHGAALLEEARVHGRPDHALHKAIDRYCKLYRLYPMPELPASLQKHFPGYQTWDGSVPDAAYREPPAPPPDRGPDAPDEDDAPAPAPAARDKRDGMQDVSKAGPSKASDVDSESLEAYKRIGRANGLQRRHGQQLDLTLPPVTVLPCPTASCTCDLKP